MANLVKSWSYSRYSDYQQCPRRFRYKHVMRMPEPSSPALERGSAVDKGVTAYLDGAAKALPKESEYNLTYGGLKAELKDLRRIKCETQLELAVTKDWQPAGWREWDRAWLRAKLDVMVRMNNGKVIRIIDNKTGKAYPEKHAEQLEIYAAVAFAHVPEAGEIRAQMFYLDQGVASEPAVFTDLGKTIPRLRKLWEKKAAPMFRDTVFEARPGQWCHWCPYSGHRGGPCDNG